MKSRIQSLMLAVSAAALPSVTLAQAAPVAPAQPQVAKPAPTATAPTAPAVTPDPLAPAAATPPVEMPPPLWQVQAAQELLLYIRGVDREGLDPLDYDPVRLEVALRGGDPMTISRAATDSFRKIATDLALGHVRGSARKQWFLVDGDLPEGRLDQLLLQAVGTLQVAQTLNGLLPTHPQYGSLRQALSMTQDPVKVGKIRLNLDRWRWLPRDLGSRYIIVNVPGEHATLVENSVTRWKHRAIAGAVKTPTPQLSVLATGVTLNPWWEVPQSLSSSVAGKGGYVAVRRKDGSVLRWRQPPGPSNALGKIKFTMANPHAIFLHDTNARGLFDSQNRFFSHGCIRTENILDLAAELLADDGGTWTREQIDEVLKSGKVTPATFVKPVPVYIVYFSVAALTDGNIVQYKDLYSRDAPVLAALNDRANPARPGTAATKTAVR